jgi:ribosomal subunit interface protein
MDITITGRKLTITPALRDYAEEKIGSVAKTMDIDPLTVEVVLNAERNPSNPTPCVCEVTLQTKGHIIRVEERDTDMYAAIDVASAKVIRQMRKYLESEGEIGKKMDFLIQEMNRETNTIGSKASDAAIAQHVVDLKSEIEKLREQIQNVE